MSLFQLTILIISTIASIRTLPATAFFGTSLIVFYCLSALFFLIPVSFISAEFASKYPEEGGVFYWIRCAFGDKMGMLAVWLQWINTMVWYPTMLLFIAGTASYIINPDLAQNAYFLLFLSLCIFWLLTFLNLNGIRSSISLNSFSAIIGTFIPLSALIAMGVYWLLHSKESFISFNMKGLLPEFDLMNSGNAVTTIMASFLGMELAGTHILDISNPKRNFPKAIAYSVLALLGTFILGSLAIACVIPKDQILFAGGVMQTFTAFLNAFQMTYFIPLLALLIILGAIGGSVNWVLSPAQGLMQAAEKGFLPEFFLVKNKKGMAYRVLILQAVVISVFCFALTFISNINNFYWFLMALSTGLYMCMYMLLFLAALKLKNQRAGSSSLSQKFRFLLCIVGLVACVLTILFGFQPAPGIVIESRVGYIALIAAGFGLLLAPVLFFWKYQEKRVSARFKDSEGSTQQ